MFKDLLKYTEIFKLAITRAKKENFDPNSVEKLSKYITDSAPFNYAHFSNDDHYKGVNIKSEYDTPLGIYAYPLTSKMCNKIIKNTIGFASDRKYIHIFQTTGNILYLDEYNKENLNDDINKLSKIYNKDLSEIIIKVSDYSLVKSYAGTLFGLIFVLAGGDLETYKHKDTDNKTGNKIGKSQSKIKSRYIFKQLGYDGIYDPGFGIIHKNEPQQAVIFDSKNIKHLDIVKNQFTRANWDSFEQAYIKSIIYEVLNITSNNIKQLKNNLDKLYNGQISLDEIINICNIINSTINKRIKTLMLNDIKNNTFNNKEKILLLKEVQKYIKNIEKSSIDKFGE